MNGGEDIQNSQETAYGEIYPPRESNKKIWIFVGFFVVVIIALSIFFFIKYSSNIISNDELSAGTYIDLKENKDVTFKLGEEEHKIIIDSVSDDSVDIIIQSEIINSNLKIGETKKFDLDDDGTYDLSVKLKSIVYGKANLFIKKISETICTENCGVICTENWNCTEWSICVDETQTRVCTDLNNCGTEENKPEESQSCEVVCVENWTCTDWGVCVEETQTRTCTDLNDCGTTEDKPSFTQICVDTQQCKEELVKMDSGWLAYKSMKDEEGNCYNLTGAYFIIKNATIEPNPTLEPSNILTDNEESLIENFQKLTFVGLSLEYSDYLNNLKITYDKVPSMIIAWDEEDEEYFTIPFFVNNDSSIDADIVSKNISLLPIVTI